MSVDVELLYPGMQVISREVDRHVVRTFRGPSGTYTDELPRDSGDEEVWSHALIITRTLVVGAWPELGTVRYESAGYGPAEQWAPPLSATTLIETRVETMGPLSRPRD